MSNAKRFPGEDCESCSRCSSLTPTASSDGAMTTPSDSNTLTCTIRSGARPKLSYGSTSSEPIGRTISLAECVSVDGYLARAGSIAERIAVATEQPDVLALLREGTAALGAENAVFVSFVRDSEDLSACRFMLACDPRWCRQYLEAGCIAHDPWLAYSAHHSEPILASALAIAEAEQRRVVDLATGYGFASAALFPAHSGAGHSRISLLCLGSAEPGFFEGGGFGRFKIGARTIALELHDWWLARIRRELIVKARITPSDLVLLRHQRQGHSSKRIAAELHVSKSSINSRFQRMNMKLGVANRRMAAQLASECGLILN